MSERTNDNPSYSAPRTRFGKTATINEDLDIGGSLVRDDELEHLSVRGSNIGLYHLRVEDCPALASFNVEECDPDDPNKFEYPQTILWLKLDKLPALRSVKVCSGIRTLEISALPMLEELDLSGCSQLAYAKIEAVPALRKINIAGCVKLGGIDGLDEVQRADLDLPNMIAENQASSKLDGSIYEAMTAKDIEMALQAIRNEAAAIGEDLDLYGFILLGPEEPCYTSGSGETYTYAMYFDMYGQHTPEDCLKDLREKLDLGIEERHESEEN